MSIDWKPIDTAPHDRPVLLFDQSDHYGNKPKGKTWVTACYRAYAPTDVRYPGGTWECLYGPGAAVNPTHWAELDEPA